MKKITNKKYYVLVLMLFVILFLQLQTVKAQDIVGYNKGVGAYAYDSSKDDLAISHKTLVLFDNSNDNLFQLQFSALTALNPDRDYYADNSWWIFKDVRSEWYYIQYAKIEIKLQKILFDRFSGIYESSFYSGDILPDLAKSVTVGGGQSNAEAEWLYDFMIGELLGEIPYIGIIASFLFTLYSESVPQGDSFTEGTTSISRWWKYTYKESTYDDELGLFILCQPTQDIPKGIITTYYKNYHRLYITYTIGVKTKFIHDSWIFGLKVGAILNEFSVSRSIQIDF